MNPKAKKYRIIALLFAILCVVAGGYLYGRFTASGGAASVPDASGKELTMDQKVDAIVDSMSTTEKVGQLVMIGIHGTDVTEDSLYMLHQFHFGGVILFDRNLESADQVQRLTQHLQEQADEKVPLLIGIDEEGGDVVRGKGIIEPPPAQLELGRAGNAMAVTDWAAKTGKRLKDLGINVNFAPVADVGSPDRRSFSKDPETVRSLVEAAAQGYESQGEIYALKHFPGIGKGRVDSHQEISEIGASKDTLEKEDLVPFKAVIDNRQPSDYLILVSHLKYPALDAQNPASQSRAIMDGLLRGELGYQGVIITDDMEMGAVAKHDSYRSLGAKAIEAGADIVMICHEYEHEQDIYMGILDAVKSGEISEERLNASVRRIVAMKLLHQL